MHKWQPTRTRRFRVRQFCFLILLPALTLAVGACTALWNSGDPEPILTLRQPVRVGAKWEATLSVSNMPDGGVTGICIADGGITIDRATEGSATVSGLNGFIVSAQDLAPPSPRGVLLAVAPSSMALSSGKVLRLSFASSHTEPRVTLDSTKVTLISKSRLWIETWTLRVISGSTTD